MEASSVNWDRSGVIDTTNRRITTRKITGITHSTGGSYIDSSTLAAILERLRVNNANLVGTSIIVITIFINKTRRSRRTSIIQNLNNSLTLGAGVSKAGPGARYRLRSEYTHTSIRVANRGGTVGIRTHNRGVFAKVVLVIQRINLALISSAHNVVVTTSVVNTFRRGWRGWANVGGIELTCLRDTNSPETRVDGLRNRDWRSLTTTLSVIGSWIAEIVEALVSTWRTSIRLWDAGTARSNNSGLCAEVGRLTTINRNTSTGTSAQSTTVTTTLINHGLITSTCNQIMIGRAHV